MPNHTIPHHTITTTITTTTATTTTTSTTTTSTTATSTTIRYYYCRRVRIVGYSRSAADCDDVDLEELIPSYSQPARPAQTRRF